MTSSLEQRRTRAHAAAAQAREDWQKSKTELKAAPKSAWIEALAAQNQLCDHYTARMLPLAYLAPDLQQRILEGRQPAALTLAALTDAPLPLDWDAQRQRFAAFG